MPTTAKIMTRLDCILVAEAFVRSGLKGISVARSETSALSKSFLSRVIVSSFKADDFDENTEQAEFKRRQATRQELEDGNRLTEAMRITGLTQRQARLLYLRGYHRLRWKYLAERFNMSWDQVRQEYDDALHEIYYKAKL